MDLILLLKHHEILCDESYDILQEKVRNYSGTTGDVFTNFRRVEDLGICSLETGILARISDKLGRLVTHINSEGGLVGHEGFTDSIHDLINYLIFLHAAVHRSSVTDDSGN